MLQSIRGCLYPVNGYENNLVPRRRGVRGVPAGVAAVRGLRLRGLLPEAGASAEVPGAAAVAGASGCAGNPGSWSGVE